MDSETDYMELANEIECNVRCETQYGKRRRISSCDTYAAECSEIEDYEDEGPEPGNKSPSNSSKRQKRLHVSPFICPPFDNFLYLCCNGGRIRPFSRKTLQMGMQIFFKFCTVQFNSLREIKSLRFRASDGTTCSAYRDGSDGQWQHLLDFLYVDEQSWIEVHIGDDENDDLDLEIWFQWLDPSQILEELKKLLAHNENSDDGATHRALDMAKVLAKVWVFS